MKDMVGEMVEQCIGQVRVEVEGEEVNYIITNPGL